MYASCVLNAWMTILKPCQTFIFYFCRFKSLKQEDIVGHTPIIAQIHWTHLVIVKDQYYHLVYPKIIIMHAYNNKSVKIRTHLVIKVVRE